MKRKSPAETAPNWGKRLFALRGATQSLNDSEEITRQVGLLYDEILRENRLNEQDVVSLVFSITPDLDAINPATALRCSGRGANITLFAVQEARIRKGLDRTIRIILHCYLDQDCQPRHIYRNGAETLRPDRVSREKSAEQTQASDL
jgi:chorismate mutase